MSKIPIIAYLKYIFYRKISGITSYNVLLITTYFTILYVLSKLKLPLTVNWEISKFVFIIYIIAGLMPAIIYSIKLSYSNFIDRKYKKTIIPEEIENIESEVKPDVWLIIKDFKDRIEKLEKESPIKLAILAFFFSIFLTIALYLLPKILPR